jgi:predicted AAA+ superfamily ATPase
LLIPGAAGELKCRFFRHFLKKYDNALYLEREVQAESLVRNIDSFARFLEVISFSHGSLLNTTEIARESEIKRTTVQGYLSILEDLLLADFIPVFSRKAKRSLITHNKFYYFDCGVFSSLRPFGPLDKRDEISGPALEGLVYQHLKAWLAYSNYNAGISFWRTRTGLEVDFVIYGDCGFYAFEVKNTDKIHNNELKSLKAFREDYPQCTVCFLYRGEQKTIENGIPCLPVTDFLLNLKPGQIFELFSQSARPRIE